MAGPLRIEYPGAWYHVTSRRNERAEIFRDDMDRRRFLEALEESIDIFKVEVHGYVVMSNHIHSLLRTREADLGRFMQRFNRNVWPVDVGFDESNLKESGADMGSLLTSDRVYSQSGSGYGGDLSYGWLSSSDSSWHGTFTGFRRGYGCWYKINGSKSPFSWSNLKPYSEPPY